MVTLKDIEKLRRNISYTQKKLSDAKALREINMKRLSEYGYSSTKEAKLALAREIEPRIEELSERLEKEMENAERLIKKIRRDLD